MTTHTYNRTSTVRRPATGTTIIPSAPARRPFRRWIAPVGLAAAVAAAGIGGLIYNANSQPSSVSPAAIEDSTVGNGEVLRPGVPDGYFQPAILTRSAGASLGEPSTAGTGRVTQSGMPDGYFQPIENTSPTAPVANYGCKTTGPC